MAGHGQVDAAVPRADGRGGTSGHRHRGLRPGTRPGRPQDHPLGSRRCRPDPRRPPAHGRRVTAGVAAAVAAANATVYLEVRSRAAGSGVQYHGAGVWACPTGCIPSAPPGRPRRAAWRWSTAAGRRHRPPACLARARRPRFPGRRNHRGVGIMSLYGMDLEQGEHLAKELSRASRRFAQLSGQPDTGHHRQPLARARRRAVPQRLEDPQQDAAGHLGGAAGGLGRRAGKRPPAAGGQFRTHGRRPGRRQPGRQQQSGSAATTLLDTLIAGAGGAAGDLWDGTGEFIDTVGELWATRWAMAWAGSEAGHPRPRPIWLTRAAMWWAGCATSAASAGTSSRTGEPPSVTELIAGGTVLLAAGVNASVAAVHRRAPAPAPAR